MFYYVLPSQIHIVCTVKLHYIIYPKNMSVDTIVLNFKVLTTKIFSVCYGPTFCYAEEKMP